MPNKPCMGVCVCRLSPRRWRTIRAAQRTGGQREREREREAQRAHQKCKDRQDAAHLIATESRMAGRHVGAVLAGYCRNVSVSVDGASGMKERRGTARHQRQRGRVRSVGLSKTDKVPFHHEACKLLLSSFSTAARPCKLEMNRFHLRQSSVVHFFFFLILFQSRPSPCWSTLR